MIAVFVQTYRDLSCINILRKIDIAAVCMCVMCARAHVRV